MKLRRFSTFVICGSLTAALTACGGGGLASIGGTISGLGSGLSVVIQNNLSNTLTLSSNGAFTFANTIGSNTSYNVTVQTQPVGQTCSVANGSGTVDTQGDNITSVAITCQTSSSVGGTLSGLSAGTSVTLTNNGQTLTLAANGLFAFPGLLAAGTTYNVVVSTQPAGLTCSVTNPTGTVVSGVESLVTVSCS